jgi:hypothetical protein
MLIIDHPETPWQRARAGDITRQRRSRRWAPQGTAPIGRLIVTGAQTDECIRSTIHGALTRGYDVTLVGDAHTTQDQSAWGAPPPQQVIAHTNLYWRYHRAPGRSAAVTDTENTTFTT